MGWFPRLLQILSLSRFFATILVTNFGR